MCYNVFPYVQPPNHRKMPCIEFKNQRMFVVWIPHQSRRREPYGGLDHPSIQVLHRSRSFHAAHLAGGSHVALLRHMDASPLLPVSGRPVGEEYLFLLV